MAQRNSSVLGTCDLDLPYLWTTMFEVPPEHMVLQVLISALSKVVGRSLGTQSRCSPRSFSYDKPLGPRRGTMPSTTVFDALQANASLLKVVFLADFIRYTGASLQGEGSLRHSGGVTNIVFTLSVQVQPSIRAQINSQTHLY